MDQDQRKRGLLERWSHLESARLRTPCVSEAISIVTEQIRVQDELCSLGEEVHPTGAR